MIVLRHSDSCTEDASLKDHDRPITVWGRTLAAELGKNLVAIGWASPDLVLCSASARSRETLRELANVHGAIEAAETHFLGSLYHFAAMDGVTACHLKQTIVATVGAQGQGQGGAKNGGGAPGGVGAHSVRTVMCIGHNKGWEEAASDFAGAVVKLEVANAALLECASGDVVSWEQAFAEGADVKWVLKGVVQPGLVPPEEEEGENEGFGGSFGGALPSM